MDYNKSQEKKLLQCAHSFLPLISFTSAPSLQLYVPLSPSLTGDSEKGHQTKVPLQGLSDRYRVSTVGSQDTGGVHEGMEGGGGWTGHMSVIAADSPQLLSD